MRPDGGAAPLVLLAPGGDEGRRRSVFKKLPRPGERAAFLTLLLAVLFVLALLPFGRLIGAALAPGGRWNPGAALAEMASRAGAAAALHTLETGLASALLALLLGAGVALLLAACDLRAKRPLLLLWTMSMLVAPQVTALAFLSLTGPASPLLGALGLQPAPGTPNPLTGRWGVILVLGLHHAPLVTITLMAGLRRLPHALVEAAALDGASSRRIAWSLLLPLLRPHLVGAALLAFVAAVGNFGIPALLGMPAGYLTLPTLIYRRLSSFGPSVIPDAAALSLLIGGIAGLGVLGAALALRRAPVRFETDRPLAPFIALGRARAPAEAALWALIGLALVLPLLSLLATALVPAVGVPLSPASATLDKFAEVLLRQSVTIRAFRNSFLLSGLAALTLALLSVALAYGLERHAGRARRPVEALLEIPYALPGIVLAIACILLFLRPLPLLGVSLYATPLIILFAYLARFLPMALKAPLAAMAALERDQEEAAALDGASPLRRLVHVVLPALAPAAVAGGLLVFLTAFNELTVSALLWSAGTETLGVALFSLEEAGLAGEAAAIALLATAVVAAAMLLLDRLGSRLPEGVLPWRP